jgi:hypothetical protein
LRIARHRGKEIFAVRGATAIVPFYGTADDRQFVPKYATAIADRNKKF